MKYDRARTSLDRHATYIVAAYVVGGGRWVPTGSRHRYLPATGAARDAADLTRI
jgi:hypothetical protein